MKAHRNFTVSQSQAKHIPDNPVLRFLGRINPQEHLGACAFPDMPNSVQNAMPNWVNEKLASAKMRALIRRGLVDGCVCGCRGDFLLTNKGKAVLEQPERCS